jgi:hypothetical protein
MSRTFKDKPYKIRQPTSDYWHDSEMIQYTIVDEFSNEEYTRHRPIQLPTTKPKRRKELDTENHWMSTPSWHNHLYNNIPRRREGRHFERTIHLIDDIEEADPPEFSKKPHKYYW